MSVALIQPRDDWRDRLIRTKTTGEIKPLLANAILALRHSPEWQGVLAFNTFAMTTVARAAPPWAHGANDWTSCGWTPHDDHLTTDWLQHQRICVGLEIAQQAVETVARDSAFHPVRDYLRSLSWDGTERLPDFLPDYFGSQADGYTRQIGKLLLIAAVARVMQPGCKFDCVLILEGAQGLGKSTALRILGEPWFSDEMADLGSKDAAMQVAAAWIIEVGELDAMSRAESSRLKAFFARSTDRFRPPYGRRIVESPRQSVFVGSTNADCYLRDETGNRRFWPVKVGAIDTAALQRDRDQIWAEAVARYEMGEPWWISDKAITNAASEAQAERYAGDPWDEPVRDFLAARDDVSVAELLGDCLGIERHRWTQGDQNRIARILRSAEWWRYQRRTGDKREWRYRRERW